MYPADYQWLLFQEKQAMLSLLMDHHKTNYGVFLPSPPLLKKSRLNLIKSLNLNTNLQEIQRIKEKP